MKKDDKYLKQYMKEHLRECQLKQLGILEVIDGICRKHGIDYWLEGGTLLGAVRHGGFIPWDDDIDIAMKQADLRRFCQVAPDELPEDLFSRIVRPTREARRGVSQRFVASIRFTLRRATISSVTTVRVCLWISFPTWIIQTCRASS